MPEEADAAAASALHAVSPPDASWSSVNLAEAVPGVMTPLCASVWVPARWPKTSAKPRTDRVNSVSRAS